MESELKVKIAGHAWETSHEISFLRGWLGYAHKSTSVIPRVQLLIRYRAALEKRKRWDNVDRIAVFAEIDRLCLAATGKSLEKVV